jgi:hypothetical protein
MVQSYLLWNVCQRDNDIAVSFLRFVTVNFHFDVERNTLIDRVPDSRP